MANWEMLGAMFSPDGNIALGWVMHLMMGLIFGLVHWLVVGLMMGGIPMIHAGIKSGAVSAPGVFMLKNGGLMGFMGGLIGHAIFGVVVALVYGLLES